MKICLIIDKVYRNFKRWNKERFGDYGLQVDITGSYIVFNKCYS